MIPTGFQWKSWMVSTEQAARRLATVENMQREQLHPMDEGDDFARHLQLGGTIEDIAEKAGLSLATVKRRLALASLAPEVKKAFRSGLFGRNIAGGTHPWIARATTRASGEPGIGGAT